MALAESLARNGIEDWGDRVRIALLLVIVGLVIFGPQLWTRRVFAQHSVPRPDYPGTGAELARHLLDQLDMQQVGQGGSDRGGRPLRP